MVDPKLKLNNKFVTTNNNINYKPGRFHLITQLSDIQIRQAKLITKLAYSKTNPKDNHYNLSIRIPQKFTVLRHKHYAKCLLKLFITLKLLLSRKQLL